MQVRPLDITIALKAIGLMQGLSTTDRRVATALLDHFNRKLGRCDPGIARIASLLGINKRTVMRAIGRLGKARLFERIRHGGYSHHNCYIPNWSLFRAFDAGWQTRFSARNIAQADAKADARRDATDLQDLSPSPGQSCHLEGDSPVTQTITTNQNKQTSTGLPREVWGRPAAGSATSGSEAAPSLAATSAAPAAPTRSSAPALPSRRPTSSCPTTSTSPTTRPDPTSPAPLPRLSASTSPSSGSSTLSRPAARSPRAWSPPALGLVCSRGIRSADAARDAALRRWTDALQTRFGHQPITYGEIVERIDEALTEAATNAELARRGDGIGLIAMRLGLGPVDQAAASEGPGNAPQAGEASGEASQDTFAGDDAEDRR